MSARPYFEESVGRNIFVEESGGNFMKANNNLTKCKLSIMA